MKDPARSTTVATGPDDSRPNHLLGRQIFTSGLPTGGDDARHAGEDAIAGCPMFPDPENVDERLSVRLLRYTSLNCSYS